MPLPLETARFDALKKLAGERFGTIEPAEEAVLRLSSSTEDVDPPGSENRPEVRASFLRWLATDREAAAHIDSFGLRVANATITSALDLSFCMVPFRLRFRRCSLQGELHLNSAELPALALSNCTTEHRIVADGLRVQGDVYLRRLNVRGEVRFLGARVGGDFDCSGATLTGEGDALSADKININGSVFLNEKFFSSGEVRFPNAQIGGVLDCSSATLTAEGNAFIADGANITGGVFLREGFSCSGTIRLVGARIGGDLDCANGRIRSLMCEYMRLEEGMIWIAIRDPKNSYLNLLGASIRTIRDDEASWPAPGNLVVKGLEYGDLVNHEPSTEANLSQNRLAPQRELDAEERIRWLSLQDDEDLLDPQAWTRLRQLFESKGDKRGAKKVEFAFRRRVAESKPWFIRWYEKGRLFVGRLALNLFFDLEDNLVRILAPILLLFAAGYAVFLTASHMGVFVPTQVEANAAFEKAQPLPRGYPVFSPSIYTLETILPVIKLGQVDYWAPDAQYKQIYWYCSYSVVAWTRYLLTVLGWILGLVLVTAITSRLK
jgi:hypothetical protein